MQVSSQAILPTDISEAPRPTLTSTQLTPSSSTFTTPPNAIVSFSPESTIPAVTSPVYARPINVQSPTPDEISPPSPPEISGAGDIVDQIQPQEGDGGENQTSNPNVEGNVVAGNQGPEAEQSQDNDQGREQSSEDTDPSGTRLTQQEQQVVEKLAARDREVRAHEQAHQTVGGQYAGAASYSYQTGPNGRQYAVGGEVPIDVSPVPGDPQATINKMRTVKAAATAPAEPSTADLAVASTAIRILLQAQSELAAERQAEIDARIGDLNADDVENSINESPADIFQRFAGNTDETSPEQGLTPSQIDELI